MKTKRLAATNWLKKVLSDRPVPAHLIFPAADLLGYSKRTPCGKEK